MKILQLCGFYEPAVGGIESYVKELSEKLVEKKDLVSVIARYPIGKKPKRSVEEKKGVKIYWVYSKKNTKISTLLAWVNAFFIALTLEFDIIHAHTIIPIAFFGVLLSKIKRKKIVCTIHETHFHLGIKNPIYRGIARAVLNNCDYIYCASEEIRKKVISLKINKKPLYFGNAVDTKKFTPKRNNFIRKKFRLGEKTKIVVLTRRLVEKDGVIYLIRALPFVLKKEKNLFFFITGDGPEKNSISQECSKLGIEKVVYLAGYIQNKKIPRLLNSADIFILPSLIEATSISGLEAMSCGLPLIGTRVGGIPYLIKDNFNGYLCEPKDPEDLAKKIIKLVENPKFRTFGENSRKIVITQFSWEKRANQIKDIYTSLV